MKFLATVITIAMATQGGLVLAQSAQDLLQQGSRALEGRRYVEAEAAERQASTLDPKDAKAYNNLGNALSDQELSDQEKYVQAEEEAAEAEERQASTLKLNVEAEASFRELITLDPKDANAYFNLGNALSNQKKYVEAEAAYRQAITLDPKFARAYYKLGNALSDQEKYVEAEAAYRQAITLDPKFEIAYNNLGYILQVLGRLTEARDLYLKAIKLYPDYMTARSNLEEVERLIAIAGGTLKPLSPAETTRYFDPQDPLARVRRSVVRILPTFSGNSSGAGSHGTGFVVRRQGDKAWILTARHVIRDPDEGRVATDIQIELYEGNLPAGIVASRVPVQPIKSGVGDLDLALLVVYGLPKDIQPLNFSSLPVKDGMPLAMVGHPGKARWSFEQGKLSVVSQQGLLISCPGMGPGGSGSPVLNDTKGVIGMAYEIIQPAGIKQVVGYSRTKLQETLSQWGQ